MVTLLEKDKKGIIQINIENLSKGKTSEGFDMPSYRDPEYRALKIRKNPLNRGLWDLDLTGEFKRGIDLNITESQLEFFQRLNNEKTKFIFKRVPEDFSLGMTEEQWVNYQKELSKVVLKEINKIIQL